MNLEPPSPPSPQSGRWHKGLRAKSVLALALACLLALMFAGIIGWQILDGVRNHFGESFARNLTLLKRQSILTPITCDLALSRRLANSAIALQWLQDEHDASKKSLFFQEAEGYRKDFRDHSYFFAIAKSRHFYFNDDTKPFSNQPRYTLDAAKSTDGWFDSTLRQTDNDYNINVNYDVPLQVTKVWFNIIVRDGKRKIGVAGTGLDLSAFIRDFIATQEPGVTPIILGQTGAIQAHRNQRLIAIDMAASTARPDQTLAGQLPPGPQQAALAAALAQALTHPGAVSLLHATLDGKDQLLAMSYIPELKWHVVMAVDLKAAHVIDQSWLNTVVAALVVMLGILMLGFGYAVDHLVLQPIRKLQRSATAMAHGDFSIALPVPGGDELGDLCRAFGIMATQIRNHTAELEQKVWARTQALEQASQDIARAYAQINHSIDYASLIQRSMLPTRQMVQQLGHQQFVLWRPRDVVGGDFYIFRSEVQGYLLGVLDCAGHGVAGALMTMLAKSTLDHAMNQVGIASPAALLRHTDSTMRAWLFHDDLPRGIATNMDAGLAYVDCAKRTLRYSGAKISLYLCDGQTVQEIKGDRRAIGDRRPGTYADTDIPLRSDVTYYLTTDGFLDQAGGDLGYGFGNTRFAQMLLDHAYLPITQQAPMFDRVLDEYRSSYPQRDDITLLSFRFGPSPGPSPTASAQP